MKSTKEIQLVHYRAAKNMLLSITVFCTVLDIFYFIYNIAPLNYITLFIVIAHLLIMSAFYIYRSEYEYTHFTIPLYIVFLGICIFSHALFYWKIGQVTAFLWFPLLSLSCTIFKLKKVTMFINVFVFFCAISVFLFSPLINWELQFTEQMLDIFNIVAVLGTLIITMLMVHYYNSITLKTNGASKENSGAEKSAPVSIEEENNLKLLYSKILECFEKEQPFRKHDFNIAHLASTLNSNIGYISKAIKHFTGLNFNQFINKHRIDFVLSMIDNGLLSQYTLFHIYTEAGFKYQSTFNATFRKIMHTTPSEYIALKKAIEPRNE